MSFAKRKEPASSDHQSNGQLESFLGERLAALMGPMARQLIGPDAPPDRRCRLLHSLVRGFGEEELSRIRGQTASSRPRSIYPDDEDEIIDQIVEHLAVDPTTRTQLEHLISSNLVRSPGVESTLVRTLMKEPAFLDTTRRIEKYILTGRSSWLDLLVLGFENGRKLLFCILLLVVLLWVPRPQDLSPQAHRAMAIFAFTAALWITEALPLAVSALIGCALCAVFEVAESKAIFAGFGSHVVLFLVGALMLGVAVKKVGLHKRVSHLLLSRMGGSPARFLFGVGLLGFLMSMVIPVHCVVAMLVPSMMATISALHGGRPQASFSTAIMLNLAYSSSIGSLTTLIGGGRNPLAIGLYHEHTGQYISFLDWTVAALPVVIVMFLFNQLFLRWYFALGKEIDLEAGLFHMRREVQRLGPISTAEIRVLLILTLAVVLWITLGIRWGLAVVAVIVSSLLFALNIVRWRDIEKQFPWGLLFLYGGAVSLAGMVDGTGATEYLARYVLAFSNGNLSLFFLLATVIAVFLTEVISNAACLAILLPVLLSLVASTGQVDPAGAMFLVAFGTGLAFMLPISTPGNALVFASGYVSIRDMIKCGIWLNLAGIVTLMTLGRWWWSFIGLM